MKRGNRGVLAAAAALALCGTGVVGIRAHSAPITPYGVPYASPSADGRGEFPIGTDHHVGQFSFAVTLGHNGPEGSFEFNELNGQRQHVEHILLRPIDVLSIAGHTARIEGATVWHGRNVRVRVIATDDGEHHDSLSVRVVAVDGPDAGKALYEVGGVLTTGAIHVNAS